MAEEKRAPEQDASEGDRATIERELNRQPGNDNGSGSIKKPDMPSNGPRGGDKPAFTTPAEPVDQNGQTVPSSP